MKCYNNKTSIWTYCHFVRGIIPLNTKFPLQKITRFF